MPLPDDFAQECLYSESAWFLHDLLEIDVPGRSVTGLVDTTRLGPLVDAQVELPGHPKHLPGAVCVQLTGTLGAVLSSYVLQMRRSDGWVGFGTHIHHAKFPSIGTIGPPVQAQATVKSLRVLRQTTFVRYAFRFTQEDRDVYLAEHSAAWFHKHA